MRLRSPEIADMLDNLVLGENGDQFVGYKKSITGPINIDYVNSCMSKNRFWCTTLTSCIRNVIFVKTS
jgi:uncharacterized membrane protein